MAEFPDANRIAGLQHFDEQLSKLDLAELQQLARSLQLFSKDEARAHILQRHLLRAGRPDPRRPRREQDVTYRVDVSLSGTTPPVWRRLDLSSALMLNDVDVGPEGEVRYRFADLEAEAEALEDERAHAPAQEAKLGRVVFASDD